MLCDCHIGKRCMPLIQYFNHHNCCDFKIWYSYSASCCSTVLGIWGPFHWQFFHCNSGLMANLFPMILYFCTCYSSPAVVSCANFVVIPLFPVGWAQNKFSTTFELLWKNHYWNWSLTTVLWDRPWLALQSINPDEITSLQLRFIG